MLERWRSTYNEYPREFWALMGATLVDNLGRFLLFPYFSLYLTSQFGASLTQVGYLFAIFSISSMIGGFIGGAITDKFGRKSMLLFGLVTSALSSLAMAFITDLGAFYALSALVGLLSNAGGPAQQAMIADLLPEKKLADGYGMNRVAFNISATIGPAIGGALAAFGGTKSFVGDDARDGLRQYGLAAGADWQPAVGLCTGDGHAWLNLDQITASTVCLVTE